MCSVELRVSPFRFVTANGLENVLTVEEIFEDQLIPIKIADSKTAVIGLKLELYVTAFSISTRDGRSLREVLADRGLYEGDLILHGQRCLETSSLRADNSEAYDACLSQHYSA